MDQGQLVLGMVRALADDVRKTVLQLTAPEAARNPAMIEIVRACATGLAFHQLLADVAKRTPEKDRAMVRSKIIEFAENTAAGLPTSVPGAPRN